MKRRKNADDDIRKLERAAFQGVRSYGDGWGFSNQRLAENREAIIAYWRACLKAGKLPKATESYGKNNKSQEWRILDEVLIRWTKGVLGVLHQRIDAAYSYEMEKGMRWSHPNVVLMSDDEDAEEEVMARLRKVVEFYDKTGGSVANPRHKRRNADDLLRKLEESHKAASAVRYCATGRRR